MTRFSRPCAAFALLLAAGHLPGCVFDYQVGNIGLEPGTDSTGGTSSTSDGTATDPTGSGGAACPARDDSVSLSFSLDPAAGDEKPPFFDGECSVTSVGKSEVEFDCAGAMPTLMLSASPAPDLGAFTPGLVVRVESYQQSPPDLDEVRVSAGGDVLLFARTGQGSLHADDWSPLQFSDEAFCEPGESDDCGYTFARYMFSAATANSEPVVLHDGAYADVGAYQVWVPEAIEVEVEGNACADAYPGRYTMAMLRRP